MRWWRVLVGLGLLGAALLGGCRSESTAGVDPVRPVRPVWRSVALPAPSGPAGRLLLRDAVACADRWYLVGAVVAVDGVTRPAAWSSSDGANWTVLPVRPVSHYGRQNVLYAAGCRNGRVAVIGAQNGGAHGNPRVSNWHHDDTEGLVEIPAPFELYGGPNAASVSRIAGGPAGWLIVGSRVSGAAAWRSADATRFELIEQAPELATDDRGRTSAYDVVGTPTGWLAVGGLLPPGRTAVEPLVWTSADGRTWHRETVADGPGRPQRVVLAGTTPVAVGVRDGQFGAWRPGPNGWRRAGRFGDTSGAGLSVVRGMTVVRDRVVAAVDGGPGLWVSADEGGSWRPMEPPTPLPTGGDTALALAAAADRLVLTVSDARGATVWFADLSAPDQ